MASTPTVLPRAALTLTSVLLSIAACKGRPARIVAGWGRGSDTVVVHSRRPVRLPAQVFDSRGRAVRVSGLHYRRVAGDPLRVSEDGWATCHRSGDAELHVSLGALSTRMHLLCRPIRGFRIELPIRLVVGGPGVELPLHAVGLDGEHVEPIAGTATVRDGEVVSLRKLTAYPRAVGETRVHVQAGDCEWTIGIEVYERVPTPDALRPYQEFVAPVRLVGGEVRSWRVVPGVYRLALQRAPGAREEPVLGAIRVNCSRNWGPGYFCIAQKGASVVVRHPRPVGEGAVAAGELSILRVRNPWSPDPDVSERAAGDAAARPAAQQTAGPRHRRRPACETFWPGEQPGPVRR